MRKLFKRLYGAITGRRRPIMAHVETIWRGYSVDYVKAAYKEGRALEPPKYMVMTCMLTKEAIKYIESQPEPWEKFRSERDFKEYYRILFK